MCDHSPLAAEDCQPHKSLRLTVKAFIKSKEKKNEKNRSTSNVEKTGTPSGTKATDEGNVSSLGHIDNDQTKNDVTTAKDKSQESGGPGEGAKVDEGISQQDEAAPVIENHNEKRGLVRLLCFHFS